MTMDAVRIDTLPTTKSLLSTKVSDTTVISKDKDDDILFIDDNDEDDEIRLRLSDDEELEQDNISRFCKSQQKHLDIERNDLEFDVHIAVTSKDTLNLHPKALIHKQESSQIDQTILIEEENFSDSHSLSKKFVNEKIVDINDEESTMSGSDRIPPLMHNSPKYWSNNFDKRWKGANNQSRNRQSFPHRNSNDWYNKQYSEKEKFNNRNSFSSHNNHYNSRVRNSTGGSYNGHSRENYNRDSPKLKNKISSSGDSNANHSIQENGVINDMQLKENNSSARNDNSTNESSKQNEKETENSEINSDQKKDEPDLDKLKLSAELTCVNDSNNHSVLENNIKEKLKAEVSDIKNSDDDNLSSTKDCDMSMTEVEIENSESQLQEINKNEKNKCNSITNEEVLKDAKSKSDFDNLVDNELSDNTSHSNDISKKDKSENVMEVDDNNENLCSISDKNSNSNNNKTNTSGNAKDFDVEDNNSNDSNVSEKVSSETKVRDCLEQEAKSTNEQSDKKLNNDIELNAGSNLSADVNLTSSEMEMSNSKIVTDDKLNEVMDIETDNESSKSLSKNVVENRNSKLVADENSKEEVKSVDEEKQSKDIKQIEEETSSSLDNVEDQEKLSVEEVDLADDESESAFTANLKDNNDTSETNIDAAKNVSLINKDTSLTVPITTINTDKVDESNESSRAVVHKRRRRKRMGDIYQEVSSSDISSENGVRQKRRSARNAEEMIRKEILKNDEEDDDSDEKLGRLVTVHYKVRPNSTSLQAQPQSPPSLKRSLEDTEMISESVTLKKIRSSTETAATPITKSPEKPELTSKSKESITVTRELVRKISQEDIRGKLRKLTPEDMEALLVQKIVECITIRGEMGKLREQARASKRNQEATRLKCQQLQKQVEGFEMVLKRFTFDKNSNGEKYVPPIKINRSVGLQVNFLSQEIGVQNLKQLSASKVAPTLSSSNSNITTNPNITATAVNKSSVTITQDNRAQSPRKMLKTRSPRRPEVSTVIQTSPVVATTAAPAALVMGKSVNTDSRPRTITLQNAANIMQFLPPGQQQTVVVNSTVGSATTGGATTRPTTLTIQRTGPMISKASDLIDLTDEEDKTKTSVITPVTTIASRLPRVLHTVPGSVALTNATNLRLVQTAGPIAQSTIVNNNAPRVAYVMQSGVNGGPRQLVLTSTSTIRPVTSVTTKNISTISYKQGVQTFANGTVRVLTTQAPNTVQVAKHPAPLPETPSPESNPMWKLPPPAPSLKISKVATGIVLSWNMSLSDKYAEIVSYQLYAYQEVAGTNPSAALWKKVGDVRALPLPMACTLTQFTEGNNYYFAVRAVDIHSRFGQYSKPGNISL